MDENLLVRCNQCNHIFPETEIIFNEETQEEHCPYCDEVGYLMDLQGGEI